MTSSPKVWDDALRRLQNEIPDFAIDAWIAPLAVKIHDDRLVLGCPTSFHRDRVRLHHVETIERCWNAAYAAASDAERSSAGELDRTLSTANPVELLLPSEFALKSGLAIETRALLQGQAKMRKVGIPVNARTANGCDAPHTLSAASHSGPAFSPQGLASSPSPSVGPTHAPSSTGFARSSELRSVSQAASRKSAAVVRDDSRLSSDSMGKLASVPAKLTSPGTSAGPRSAPSADLDFGLSGEGNAASDPFSFESFIVGPCNALAREATLALARRRQRSLNQLYLGGAAGMGKTHLARAAATEARRMVQSAGLHSHQSDPRGAVSDAYQSYRNSGSRRDPRVARRVVYTSAEQFTSDFVSAMRNGRNDEWTRRFRGAIDLLVVEDIHTFAGRTKTQEELALTISHVLDSGGRVLLTGDRAPRNLTGLDESLRAQVSRGFVAELDRPDPLVRRHILRAKAAAGGINLPPECLDLLVDATGNSSDNGSGTTSNLLSDDTSYGSASPNYTSSDNTSSDNASPSNASSGNASLGSASPRGLSPWRNSGASVRDIESVLIQVVTTASLLGRAIDVDLTREAIDLKSGASTRLEPAKLSVAEVVRIVAAFFGKRPEALASRSRRRDVLVPRQLAMYLAHRYTGASLTEIGRGLGRDHPAVRNALTRVERQVLESAPLRYQVEALSERIDRRIEDARL